MIKKTIILFIILFINIKIYAEIEQNNSNQKNSITIPGIPVQSQYSGNFDIKDICFVKVLDVANNGEILEVQFILKNNIDESQDLYLFVIATYETGSPASSLEMPVPERDRMRNFVPFPSDKKNFEYPDPENGNAVRLIKYPRDPKAGVDAMTGKLYHLTDKLSISTRHLSRYRNKYFFFNEVAILVFDKDGNPVFKQLYSISGRRR